MNLKEPILLLSFPVQVPMGGLSMMWMMSPFCMKADTSYPFYPPLFKRSLCNSEPIQMQESHLKYERPQMQIQICLQRFTRSSEDANVRRVMQQERPSSALTWSFRDSTS